jgi:hypothetical protein|tara:strand:+ start:6138 stop:7316 length:1179 start_codon:yes stop_codon:yes gene_type:complete
MSESEELNVLDLPDDQVNDAIAAEMARLDSEESAEDFTEEGGIEVDEQEEIQEEETEEGESNDEPSEDSEDEAEGSGTDPEADSSHFSDDDTETIEGGSDEDSDGSEESDVDSEEEIDYKVQYEQLLSPFKANGKDIKVDTVEDARSLMQMGANYNKKMAALKPNLKVVKMLDNHGLLDEQKLSYLIDLSKQDPEAVKKLVKDSGIDPLDIDTDNIAYRPNAYNVSDSEVALDGILDDIRDTSTFNTTIDIIGNKWDEASKDMIAKDPNIIKVINDHVGSGIFKKVSEVVERERILGRLNGLSDIEAYKQVGDAINSSGGFGDPVQVTKTQPTSISKSNSVNKANNPVDPKLKVKRKAAGSTKSKPSKAKPQFDVLSMSDEEFEKMSSSKFV